MPINLKSIIEDESAIKSGRFSGAIFLTYTLNLAFFEQIIIPALEQAGCSNVVIIADPDGYNDALERGLKNISYAGLRYLNTPFPRKGYGVQHIKLLLMFGPERGRLLIGSGNLTLHGYSKNLEIFSHFEFDKNNPEPESQLAFYEAWNLLSQMIKNEVFSDTTVNHINAISENIDWLNYHPADLLEFQIWHNYEHSIWSQFMNWRERAGLSGDTTKTLRVFSPYYDSDCGMLIKFQENLLPSQVDLYFSQKNTTLDGSKLQENWPEGLPIPNLFDIMETQENISQRLLHAKIVVGIEDSGSWCISGSANMTRAALARTYHDGSNLEMVNFHWSSDPTAFDYLLEKPGIITPIDVNALLPTRENDVSEKPQRVFQNSITLTELTCQNDQLTGQLSSIPEGARKEGQIHFLRSDERMEIEISQDLRFLLPYKAEGGSCEAALIKGDGFESLPRWIDFPSRLQEYGARPYQARIQTKIDTVFGAESLLHELMDYLWGRASNKHNDNSWGKRPIRYEPHKKQSSIEDKPIPEVDEFIVPERDATGRILVDPYTQNPYDQSTYSLRNLLSLALIRLTQPSSTPTEHLSEDDANSSEKRESPDKDEQELQAKARQRLCGYLVNYCERYAQRLCDSDFIGQISPIFLLENHLTLSRVLSEFLTHVEEFSTEIFTHCYWKIWAPLVWPSIIGMESKSSWELLSENHLVDDFISAWNQLNVSGNLVVMTSQAFDEPPPWSTGLSKPELTAEYLAISKLISIFKEKIGIKKWDETVITKLGINQIQWDESKRIFKKIANYKTPIKERLTPLLVWIKLTDQGQKIPLSLIELIKNNGLVDELESYNQRPRPVYAIDTNPDEDGEIYCSHCFGAITSKSINAIQNGKLVLCSINADAWLYKEEELPPNIS